MDLERRQTMEALQASATAMSAALDLGELVQVVVDRAVTTFRADAVALQATALAAQTLVEPDAPEVLEVAAQVGAADKEARRDAGVLPCP